MNRRPFLHRNLACKLQREIRQLIKSCMSFLGVALACLVGAAIILTLINNHRFDATLFSDSAERLLERTRRLADRASGFA